jgi:hypothetical protein
MTQAAYKRDIKGVVELRDKQKLIDARDRDDLHGAFEWKYAKAFGTLSAAVFDDTEFVVRPFQEDVAEIRFDPAAYARASDTAPPWSLLRLTWGYGRKRARALSLAGAGPAGRHRHPHHA